MTKELIMSLYKTNVCIKIYNGMIGIHLYTSELMERTKCFGPSWLFHGATYISGRMEEATT